MSKATLAGLLGILTILGLGSFQAVAGGFCDCDYRDCERYAYGPPAYTVYTYEPRVLYRRYERPHMVAYYAPLPYGHAFVSRGPAVLTHRDGPRGRGWRRDW